jgi:hypothetical protein
MLVSCQDQCFRRLKKLHWVGILAILDASRINASIVLGQGAMEKLKL